VARFMLRLIVAVAALTLLVAPPAFAWTVHDVIRDCAENGKLTHNYPPSLIRQARNSLPSDVDEYTDCRDLLSNALSSGSGSGDSGGGSSGSGGGTGGGGGGGGGQPGGGGSSSSGSAAPAQTPAAPPSAAELKALNEAKSDAGSIDVGGTPITPGAAGMTTGAVDNGLPSTLLVVLILLALAVAAAGGPVLRGRFASGRRLPLSRVFVRRKS
jgi:hypothetical protein